MVNGGLSRESGVQARVSPVQASTHDVPTLLTAIGQENSDEAGTVGWARTTDLLFHRQAL